MAEVPGRSVRVIESPWMPLSGDEHYAYPHGAVDTTNLASQHGCDSVLTTTTVAADGRIAACCGIGARLIPELQIGQAGVTSLSEADAIASNDFIKRWIRVEGPHRILAWASNIDRQIEWEGKYAHQCQACLRLYQDDRVRRVIRDHYREKVPDILLREWLIYGVRTPRRSDALPAADGE